jgi:hypothetical protein
MTCSGRARLIVPLLCLAAAPPDLAAAVRAYFDDPPRAAAALEALHAADPQDPDVAWWLARVRLDEGDAAGALTLLVARRGTAVPERDFAWLRARALEAAGDGRARAEADRAVALAEHPPAPDLRERRGLAAILALRAGDEGAAREQVVAAGGALAGMWALTWREPAFPLAIRMEGPWLRVSSSGLAWPAQAPAHDVREGPGPDLVDRTGAPCLPPSAVRSDPAPDPPGWLYAADGAPEGSGIFHIEHCGATPRLLQAGSGLSSPARIDGVLWWLSGGQLSTAGETEAGPPAVQVLAAPAGGLLIRVTGSGPRLERLDGRPIFVEDLPITRADARPWPATSPSP